MSEDIKELEKKIKDPDKEFIITSVSRRDLFYMLGSDNYALEDINSLSDEEIQYAINELETEPNYEDELADKLREMLDKKEVD